MEKFTIIIVEDVPLELRGTEGILRTEVPEAEVIGTCILGSIRQAATRPRIARPWTRRLNNRRY